MRILWASNAPHCLSGYGIQSRHIVEGLQQMGHTVALAPNYGINGGAVVAGDTHIYPLWRDKVGQDVLPAHAKHFGAELVITLYDLWPYDVDFVARLKAPWAPYFPQDAYPPCSTVTERVKQADYPIAMSKFGQRSMAEQGADCRYVPHGVDTNVYVPMDKAAVRDDLKLPQDKFIVLMVAANQSFPSRKAFPECLTGFAEFHKEHPDSLLYLHTTRQARGPAWDGIELPQLIKALGIEDAVVFSEEYALVLGLPESEMAKIYNCADVLLSASMGEGFGVPIIEAQACGVPVITSDFSAMPEITFNGLCLPPLQMSWIAINTWMALPSIPKITEALNAIHDRTPEETRAASEAGRAQIIRDYSWPVVIEQWRLLLDGIARGEKPNQEWLYHCSIKGQQFDAYDDKLSFTVNCVAGELETDRYGLEKVEVKPGDVILDIGAHVGVFSIYAARKWPEAQIFAYEPSATNYQRLLRNLELADVNNVTPFNLAVTADGRDLELALERGNTGGTSAFIKPNGHLREAAHSVTLDQIVGDQTIKLLKIDAEGTEHEILTTAKCLDRIEHISGEFHMNMSLAAKGHSISGLYQHLKSHIPAERITYTSCRMSE